MRKFLSVILVFCLCAASFCQPGKKALAAATYNYGEAMQKAIMFYEFQRSGKLPENKRDNWRGDSGLTDGADVGLDLTGGLYDAGDHVKFNLPMAYTQAMLAWAVYEEKDAFEKSGQLNYLMDNIKWISDYLIKCHPSANVYYYQVGDGGLDHGWWGPAEVMQMKRPSYKVDLSNPGSCVVGEAAAALASAAVVFKDSNPAYAATCINHAKQLYNFAETTKSDSGYTAANGYYSSYSGFYDELSWAGAWLYLATGDDTYLDKAQDYTADWKKEQQTDSWEYKWAHGWDDVHNGAALLLAKITGKEVYKEQVEKHLDYWTTGYNGNRITYTPKGLAWLDQWGSLRYATTTAFLAAVYADWNGCPTDKADIYNKFAKQQVDYALGSSGRSYEVGFGTNPPVHPHHRTAQGSWADSMNTPAYHRHTIIGALVGGPGNDDSYKDEVSNYTNNEVACDYNAGFVGALGKMYERYGGDPIPNLTAMEKVTNDEFFVEAGINASGSNFIELKALMNNQSGWPARMGDKLSFKYFIDVSEILKAGYSVDDIEISTNYNNGATVTKKLIPWDTAKNIYYVNVDFSGTKIYPGGQQYYHKEVQVRIAAPQNTSFWDNTNDFSYQDIAGIKNGNAVKTAYIPVYDNGVLVYGKEPSVNTEKNSSITPTQAAFDKADPEDVSVLMTLNGNTLTGIKNGAASLVSGTDYTVSGNTVTLSKSYLAKQKDGKASLTFDFSAGTDPVLDIMVTDSSISNATITPSSAVFDKNPDNQANVAVTMKLNGNTLVDILDGSSKLVRNTDYMVSGDTVTILKSYLAEKSKGSLDLTFDFSAGTDPVLALTVIDSSVVVSGNIKLQEFNSNTQTSTNTLMPRFKLTNTGATAMNLSDVKIRYYYTIDKDKAQSFWCDWSSAGSSNIVGNFVQMDTPVSGADYYLEIGFKSGAGVLEAGKSVEVQGRFAKADWSDYSQSDDYSFNGTSTTYSDCDNCTVYISDKLAYGNEP